MKDRYRLGFHGARRYQIDQQLHKPIGENRSKKSPSQAEKRLLIIVFNWLNRRHVSFHLK